MSAFDPPIEKKIQVLISSRTLSCEEIVELVLLSINAQYQRDATKIEHMLDELKKLDHEELAKVFQGLKNGSPFEEAVPMLTNWIEAKIDGGKI